LYGQPSRWNKRSTWAIKKVTKFSTSLPQTSREEAFVANHIHEWDDHWKAVNASFEEGLNLDEDL